MAPPHHGRTTTTTTGTPKTREELRRSLSSIHTNSVTAARANRTPLSSTSKNARSKPPKVSLSNSRKRSLSDAPPSATTVLFASMLKQTKQQPCRPQKKKTRLVSQPSSSNNSNNRVSTSSLKNHPKHETSTVPYALPVRIQKQTLDKTNMNRRENAPSKNQHPHSQQNCQPPPQKTRKRLGTHEVQQASRLFSQRRGNNTFDHCNDDNDLPKTTTTTTHDHPGGVAISHETVPPSSNPFKNKSLLLPSRKLEHAESSLPLVPPAPPPSEQVVISTMPSSSTSTTTIIPPQATSLLLHRTTNILARQKRNRTTHRSGSNSNSIRMESDPNNTNPPVMPHPYPNPTIHNSNVDPFVVPHNHPPGPCVTTTTPLFHDRKESEEQYVSHDKQTTKQSDPNNDNFVRLNLRNSAGACRGARKKGSSNKKWDKYKNKYNNHSDNKNNNGSSSDNKKTFTGSAITNSGVDPMDDYLDGVFSPQLVQPINETATTIAATSVSDTTMTTTPTTTTTDTDAIRMDSPLASNAVTTANAATDRKSASNSAIPKCARHERACRLLVVKKNNKGNKGRKFYVCSLPRGEQCNHFQWAEDTVEAAQRALLKSSSHSGFVARQVAAYTERYKCLTLPELRLEAKRRSLNPKGKKGSLLTRLSIWVRDELTTAVKEDPLFQNNNSEEQNNNTRKDDEVNHTNDNAILGSIGETEDLEDDDSDNDSTTSSDDDDLEICHDVDSDTSHADEVSSSLWSKNNGEENRTNSKPISGIEDALHVLFGHSTFRDGQEWAIRRCLTFQKSLLVAPTGLGKSLCYALPASLMDGLCIVVSPLISLMQDQLRHLPPRIPAATLSGSLTVAQMATIVDDIFRRRLKVLFVSPERLASAAFRRLLRHKERPFPPVSLLCVDEAHCLSQWGHNFRPSYLRIRSLLSTLQPRSILALTATAGPMVVRDVCCALDIPHDNTHHESIISKRISDIQERIKEDTSIMALGNEEDTNVDCGVKVLSCNRDNIDVATLVFDHEEHRRSMLVKLLKPANDKRVENGHIVNGVRTMEDQPVYPGCLQSGSVIVYVWRQRDAEIIAEQLVGASVLGGIVFYHGGMDAGARAKAQNKFMRGKARIICATVAFGLGLNKADVDAVVHTCLPNSPESYLQEIGRAGRDGRKAQAICLLRTEEVVVRHSLAHSNLISQSQVSVLLQTLRTVVDSALEDIQKLSQADVNVEKLDLALNIGSTVDAMDCKQESIETLLSLLEQKSADGRPALLHVEGVMCDQATITLKRRSIEKMAVSEDVARSIQQCGVRLDLPDEKKEETGDSVHVDDNGANGERSPHYMGGTAMQKGFLAYSFGIYQISIVQCARFLGPTAEPRHVFAALRRLQSRGDLEFKLDMSPKGKAIQLRLDKNGIEQLRSPTSCKYSTNSQNEVNQWLEMEAKKLTDYSLNQVYASVGKVEKIYDILGEVASATKNKGVRSEEDEQECVDASSTESKSHRLVLFQKLVAEYFEEVNDESGSMEESKVVKKEIEIPAIQTISMGDARAMAGLWSDISTLMRDPTLERPESTSQLSVGSHCTDYTALSMAKILHGIDSPRASSSKFYGHPMFGKWRHVKLISLQRAILHLLSPQSK